MEPTLHCARPGVGCEATYADRPVVEPLRRAPHRGDILVFEAPPLAQTRCGSTGSAIKRVVGLPGETVSERDGVISINGHKLSEPYIKSNRRDTWPPGKWKVPVGRYFLLGDNRSESCDSRIWGSVPRTNIIGKVVAIFRQR